MTCHDQNRDTNHSYLESKVAKSKENKATKEGFSQTDFSGDIEIVLGQYLENRLGLDLTELKVNISSIDNHLSETHCNVASKQQAVTAVTALNSKQQCSDAAPEIVIVECEQEEII